MFKRNKSTIVISKEHKDINEYDNYDEIVEEIHNANVNLEPSAEKYNRIISEFPKMEIISSEKVSLYELKKNVLGMLTVEVFVNDKKRTFLLDTGAQVSCTYLRHVVDDNEITVSREKIEVGSAFGRKSEMEVCYAHSFEFCEMKILNLPMLVLNENQLSFSLFGKNILDVEGILGWDILKLLDFEIDYTNLSFKILNHIEKESASNFIKSDFPIVLVTDANDKILKFGIDTGSRKSWLNKNFVEKNNIDILHNKIKNVYGAHGFEKQAVHIIQEYKIKLNDKIIILKNVQTGFTGFLSGLELDGVLGIDVFKQTNLIIENSIGALYLE